MPAPLNPTNCIWGVGYLFATIAGGLADDVPFGELQEIEIKDDLSLKEAMGVSSLAAVAVGISERKVTVSAKQLKIRTRQVKALRGGAAAFASGKTTLTAGITDEPLLFNLHLKSPSDGSEAEAKVYGCISPSLQVPLKLRDWSIMDFSANVYGDGGKFYELILPGDQTTS